MNNLNTLHSETSRAERETLKRNPYAMRHERTFPLLTTCLGELPVVIVFFFYAEIRFAVNLAVKYVGQIVQ